MKNKHKVDIRIEEAWDKAAFEHRGWHNWDWLREQYAGEQRAQTAGDSRFRVGLEPTLAQMMAEMLQSGTASADELHAALDQALRDAAAARDAPAHGGPSDGAEPSRSAAGPASHGSAAAAGRDSSTPSRLAVSPASHGSAAAAGRDSSRPPRAPTQWQRGRAPWAPTEAQPWARYERLMGEIENPEDAPGANNHRPDYKADPYSHRPDYTADPDSHRPDYTADPDSHRPDYTADADSHRPDYTADPDSHRPDYTADADSRRRGARARGHGVRSRGRGVRSRGRPEARADRGTAGSLTHIYSRVGGSPVSAPTQLLRRRGRPARRSSRRQSQQNPSRQTPQLAAERSGQRSAQRSARHVTSTG